MRYLFSIFFIFFTITCFADELIIEPDMGRAPILSAIANTKSSINLVMYGFTDTQFLNTLIEAKKSGKKVNILLEPQPYQAADENTFAIKRFQNANVNLQWPNPQYKLTHQKTFLLDQRQALIMTFNLTNSSFKNQRNFALLITDPGMINEIQNVFIADWQHKNISVHHPNLIWSPNNSREKILELIRSAKSDIKIYAQNISDYQTIGALAKAARAGVSVKILMAPTAKKSYSKKFNYLTKAGVKINFDAPYIIHAKVMIIDNKLAVIGSTNLTRASINDNRELSVITRDAKVIQALNRTFDADWGKYSFSRLSDIKMPQISAKKLMSLIKKISATLT